MDTPGASNNRDCSQAQTSLPPPPNPRKDSDGEVVFYIEEPKASKQCFFMFLHPVKPLLTEL